VGGRAHRLERTDGVAEYQSEQVKARFAADGWRLLDCQAGAGLAEGERVDLSTCATLIALLQAEAVLPEAAT
jgi:hypothetical protein